MNAPWSFKLMRIVLRTLNGNELIWIGMGVIGLYEAAVSKPEPRSYYVHQWDKSQFLCVCWGSITNWISALRKKEALGH